MTLLKGRAEELPLPSDSFDHIVSTFVFCSVHDTTRSIEEVIRVARPGATLHLIEHVKGVGLPGRLHELFTPLWSRICGGCHLNRKTLTLLEKAGFELHERRVLLNFIGTPFVLARLRIPSR
jgi:ubiquinone/menaquinone biosynthesis C-methylase UbiE